MKILIVNGYPDTKEGLQSFLGFRYLVQKIFMEQTIIVDMDTEFVIRKINELDDVLYESTSTSIKTSSGRNFDNFDMIFITGDPYLRPWSKKCQNVQILIRMCLRTHKFLFACSFGMETLVFQSATNFDRSVNIINGDEGGHLTDMPQFSSQFQHLSSMDFFLENTTGDLYQFSNDKQEWSTKINTGFHNTLAAQTYSTIGKFLVKAPIYRPKNNIESSNISNQYASKNTESICYVKKYYILHWAFQDLPGTHFLVQKKSKWDIHPFSFTNSETTFVTLAESDSGPLIIQFGDYIMACQFEVIPKYFESLIPLKNFIYNKLLMISENKQSKISILNVNSAVSSADIMRDIRLRDEAKNQRSLKFDKIVGERTSSAKQSSNRTFRNSGFAATSKNIGIIVSQNAVGNQIVKANSSKDFNNLKKKFMGIHQESGSKVLKEYRDKINEQENQKIRGNSSQPKQDEQSGLPSFDQLLQARLQELGLGDDEELLEEEEPITREQVRRYLHPFLNKEYLFENTKWIPGSLKSKERKPAIRVKQYDLFKGHFHKQIKEEKSVLSNQIRSSSVLSRKGSQQSLSSNISKIPSILNNDPYKSQEELQREYYRKESQKNLGPKSLIFSIQKSKVHSNIDPNFIPNYVNQTPSKTTAKNYQYRDTQKKNWVGNQDFLLIV
ncbi:hypothetical protein ABPG72_007818 [Tetrahymena utriculariae]